MLTRAYIVMNLGIPQSILAWQLRWTIQIHKRNLGETSNYGWKTASSKHLLLKTSNSLHRLKWVFRSRLP